MKKKPRLGRYPMGPTIKWTVKSIFIGANWAEMIFCKLMTDQGPFLGNSKTRQNNSNIAHKNAISFLDWTDQYLIWYVQAP